MPGSVARVSALAMSSNLTMMLSSSILSAPCSYTKEACVAANTSTRLLHGARRAPHRVRQRHQDRLPQARAQAPPRRQPRRQEVRGALQGDRRGLLGPLRRRQAQEVRPLGPQLGEDRPGPGGRRQLRRPTGGRTTLDRPTGDGTAPGSGFNVESEDLGGLFEQLFGRAAGGRTRVRSRAAQGRRHRAASRDHARRSLQRHPAHVPAARHRRPARRAPSRSRFPPGPPTGCACAWPAKASRA